MDELEKIVASAPDNFVIQNAIIKCYEIVNSHNKIVCSISGGGDSDVMLDLLIRCGAKEKTDFVFFNTGLEYQATIDHLEFLEQKYDITIQRVRSKKPIPVSTREYGQPFWSKFASEMIHRLQLHDFTWEDKPYEDLIKEYPKCQTALQWWCNVTRGKSTQYAIMRAPYLKEFMIANPPDFKITSQCCTHTKKNPMHAIIRRGEYDLNCLGIRQSEGGVRAAALKSCFSTGSEIDSFRPIFWFRDIDKEQYCQHYGVTHSKCYTEYGLIRTGCVGCPFGKRFEDELLVLERYEPKLLKAANAVFGNSYAYTRAYLEFRESQKRGRINESRKHYG